MILLKQDIFRSLQVDDAGVIKIYVLQLLFLQANKHFYTDRIRGIISSRIISERYSAENIDDAMRAYSTIHDSLGRDATLSKANYGFDKGFFKLPWLHNPDSEIDICAIPNNAKRRLEV